MPTLLKEEIMEAPIYRPAARYIAPTVLPYTFGARTCAIGELMRVPAAWAIVLKHMPAIKFIVNAPGFEKQLDNMTLADLGVFSSADNTATLAAIDADLARLPSEQGAKR